MSLNYSSLSFCPTYPCYSPDFTGGQTGASRFAEFLCQEAIGGAVGVNHSWAFPSLSFRYENTFAFRFITLTLFIRRIKHCTARAAFFRSQFPKDVSSKCSPKPELRDLDLHKCD